jgi:hypothetical protein
MNPSRKLTYRRWILNEPFDEILSSETVVLKLQSRQDLAYAIERLRNNAQAAWDKRVDAKYNPPHRSKREIKAMLDSASEEDVDAFRQSESTLSRAFQAVAVLETSQQIATEQDSSADKALHDVIIKLKWVRQRAAKFGYPDERLGRAGSSLIGVQLNELYGALLDAEEHKIMQLTTNADGFQLDASLRWLLEGLIEATSPAASRVQMLDDLRTKQRSLCANTCEALQAWVLLRKEWTDYLHHDISEVKSRAELASVAHDDLIDRITAANQERAVAAVYQLQATAHPDRQAQLRADKRSLRKKTGKQVESELQPAVSPAAASTETFFTGLEEVPLLSHEPVEDLVGNFVLLSDGDSVVDSYVEIGTPEPDGPELNVGHTKFATTQV